MPSSRSAQLLSRLGPLKRMPVLKLLAAAEIMMLAREHIARLEPHERRRMIDLVRRGRGRPRNLSDRERDELARLIDKAGPRQLVGKVADRLSPFPLPGRVVNGRRKRSR